MGLFDIFRRKKKTESEEVTLEKENEQVETNATSKLEDDGSSVVSQRDEQEVTQTTESEAHPATDEGEVDEERQKQTEEVNDADQLGENEPELEKSREKANELTESKEAASEASQAETEEITSEKASVEESVDEEVAEANTSEQEAAYNSESDQASSEDEIEKEASTPASDSEETETATEENSIDDKYDRGLEKSRSGFGARLNKFLANFRHVDEDFFEDLEDLLIESDVGYEMAMQLSDSLREEVKLQNAKSKQDISNVIIEKMVELYEAAGEDEKTGINFAKEGPTVIMFVGVNGAGKTTTIGKMAAAFKREGEKVLLAAADTFRAGATEQLAVWAERDGVDIVTGPEKGDPAAVVFDGVKKAKKENYDVLLVDTAGRLQNKVNLMNELAKMKKILTQEIPDAPHEVLLVLDSTTGQNALNQAKIFKENTDVTGIVLTKLDGTARGGIVLAIRNELHLPVKYVGLGEKVDDLQTFDPAEFVYGLFKGLVVAK